MLAIAPSEILLLGLIGAASWALFVGAVIMGGGVAAVRRQRLVIGLLGLAVLAMAIAVPLLDQLSEGAIAAVLLGVSVVLFAVRRARWRQQPQAIKERRAAVLRSGTFRWLIGAWVAFVVLVTILGVVLARM
jgi:hypothetical protein